MIGNRHHPCSSLHRFPKQSTRMEGGDVMKRMMLSMLAVAMLVAFSAPAFAGEEKKKDEKKGGKLTQMVYGEEKKKDEKKGGK